MIRSICSALGVVLGYIAIGLLIMAGLKLGDWMLPDPPPEQIRVRLECTQDRAPAGRVPDTFGERAL